MKLNAALLATAIGIAAGNSVASPLFTAGIPANWTSIGSVGTSGADGDIGLAPGSSSSYAWVSTANSEATVGLPYVTGGGSVGHGFGIDAATNGSTLTSSLFSVEAGTNLSFWFNYVTSDGTGWADYAWARLLDASDHEVALLFTARTTLNGNTVPGFNMPAPAATLSPFNVGIIGSYPDGGPNWTPLGGSSGSCYDVGCGYTGWIHSAYDIATTGDYKLEFGVVNWGDNAFDSGMAIDGILVGSTPIEDLPEGHVPEPGGLMLTALGLASLQGLRRRKVRQPGV